MQRTGWKQKIGQHRPKIDGLLKDQLEKYGIAVSGNTLIEYILAMISNGRDREQVAQALHAFIGDSSPNFTTWAFSTIEQTIGEPVGSSTETSNPPPEPIREDPPRSTHNSEDRDLPSSGSKEPTVSASTSSLSGSVRPTNPDRRDDVPIAHVPSVVTRVTNPSQSSSSYYDRRRLSNRDTYRPPQAPQRHVPRDEHDHRGGGPSSSSSSPYTHPRHRDSYTNNNSGLSQSDSAEYAAESESEHHRRPPLSSSGAGPSSRIAMNAFNSISPNSLEKRKRATSADTHVDVTPPRFTVTLSGVPQLSQAEDTAGNERFYAEAALAAAAHARQVVSPLLVTLDEADFDENEMEEAGNGQYRNATTRKKKHLRRSDGEQALPRVRCRFWPSCDLGDQCMFVHPSEPCAYWPSCTAGDACKAL